MVDMESGQRHNESPTENIDDIKIITHGYPCKHRLSHFVLLFSKKQFLRRLCLDRKIQWQGPWSFSPPLTLIVPISQAAFHDALCTGIDGFAYPASLHFQQLAGKQELLAGRPHLGKKAHCRSTLSLLIRHIETPHIALQLAAAERVPAAWPPARLQVV